MKGTIILVGVLLVSLPLLAYFQYEWLGKVSDAEREQMQSSLRRSAIQFRDEFDREITRVFLGFQSGREDYDARLVSEVFRTNGEQFERQNPTTKQFEPAEWPAEFSHLKNTISGETYRTAGKMEFFLRYMPGPIDASIPALIIPIMRALILEDERLQIPQPTAYIIVKLNLDYIKNEFLPMLARIHFPNFQVQVVKRDDPSGTIFSTRPATGSKASSDVSQNFFSLHTAGLIDEAAPPHDDVFATRNTKTQIRVFRGFGGRAVTTQVGLDAQSGSWTLLVNHPSGSLDRAVAQVRRRNLAISSGILFLLAISVGIIVISTQRAQRLAHQQMEFVSAVSHELRTPLAVICSAGENLADGVVNDSAQTRQYGVVVRNEGRRLTEMVEQILDLAGIQAGHKTYNLRPTELAEVISGALAACDLQIRERGFKVETTIEDGTPPIAADKPALIRALQNLISNAIKYSGESRWAGIHVSSTATEVTIAIQDKGAGIAASDLPHIFEPFYRGRDVVDAQIDGSGLGLSLVKEIVEAHKGKVNVASDRREGSTFRIVLPKNG